MTRRVVIAAVLGPHLPRRSTYLAPGAVVLAKVTASGVKNVTLRGGGVVAAEWLPGQPLPFSCHHCGCPGDHGIAISNATDVVVEGITLSEC